MGRVGEPLWAIAVQAFQQGVDIADGDAAAGVAHGVGDQQNIAMENGAAGVDDIGHVTFAFGFQGFDQRRAKAADDVRGVVEVQECRSDTVAADGSDAVGKDDPSVRGFDGGTAITNLHQFP